MNGTDRVGGQQCEDWIVEGGAVPHQRWALLLSSHFSRDAKNLNVQVNSFNWSMLAIKSTFL